MPVYEKHRLVHVHIPKTAGTAIENYFHGLGDLEWGPKSWIGQRRRGGRWFELQHLTYREFVERTGFQYASYRSFAVVRNPYQRLLSDFFWHAAPPRERFRSVDTFFGHIPRDIERAWDGLIQGADQDTANLLIHARPQNHYVYDAGGHLLVDQVLRFESLAGDLAEFLAPRGLSSSFVRPVRERPVEEFLSPEQIAVINEIYAVDFERFGYEKIG
ncbi:MAG: sulfotransferase family 2 domain-containing protein [Acidobacteriota bacterium]